MSKTRKYRRKPQAKRNTSAGKPLSKGAKIALIVAAAAVVLGAILFFTLYDDGSLPVRDGVAQIDSPLWLVVNKSVTATPKYYKVGEYVPPAGYTVSHEGGYQTDPNLTYTFLYPEDEASPVRQIYIAPAADTAENVSAAALKNYLIMYGEGASETVAAATLGGHDVLYFRFDGEAKDDEGKPDGYRQAFVAYVPASGGMSIVVNIEIRVESAVDKLSDVALLAIADEAVAGVRPE